MSIVRNYPKISILAGMFVLAEEFIEINMRAKPRLRLYVGFSASGQGAYLYCDWQCASMTMAVKEETVLYNVSLIIILLMLTSCPLPTAKTGD